ncbi:hypothetical protein [Actinomadura xylanilytica]|uniref:hypothetical protein n=1 Tax=Actinomadura xylanilytica TaxID=887459 RepID=UPI00255A8C53|nr:hypothetical protein [Actinomadura xylanilytica]
MQAGKACRQVPVTESGGSPVELVGAVPVEGQEFSLEQFGGCRVVEAVGPPSRG